MEQEPSLFNDYKAFIAKAVEVGKIVYPTDGIITEIQYNLKEFGDNPEYLFSSMTGTLSEEIDSLRHDLLELRKPKKLTRKEKIKLALKLQKPEKIDERAEANKQVPYVTKLAYLAPFMLETIASSQKYHMKCGDEGITTPGEMVFLKRIHPYIKNDIKEAINKGAEFDWELIYKIRSMEKKETIDWLKDMWFKKEEQSNSD